MYMKMGQYLEYIFKNIHINNKINKTNTLLKIIKRLEHIFHERKWRFGHVKWAISLLTKIMQVKTLVKYHSIHIKMNKIKKKKLQPQVLARIEENWTSYILLVEILNHFPFGKIFSSFLYS